MISKWCFHFKSALSETFMCSKIVISKHLSSAVWLEKAKQSISRALNKAWRRMNIAYWGWPLNILLEYIKAASKGTLTVIIGAFFKKMNSFQLIRSLDFKYIYSFFQFQNDWYSILKLIHAKRVKTIRLGLIKNMKTVT